MDTRDMIVSYGPWDMSRDGVAYRRAAEFESRPTDPPDSMAAASYGSLEQQSLVNVCGGFQCQTCISCPVFSGLAAASSPQLPTGFVGIRGSAACPELDTSTSFASTESYDSKFSLEGNNALVTVPPGNNSDLGEHSQRYDSPSTIAWDSSEPLPNIVSEQSEIMPFGSAGQGVSSSNESGLQADDGMLGLKAVRSHSASFGWYPSFEQRSANEYLSPLSYTSWSAAQAVPHREWSDTAWNHVVTSNYEQQEVAYEDESVDTKPAEGFVSTPTSFEDRDETPPLRRHRKSPNAGLPRIIDSKSSFLIEAKRSGMSYRDIRTQGNFEEAESTLRGRFRVLTKEKHQRVRKPIWTSADVQLLTEAVGRLRTKPCGRRTQRVPWQKVADYITEHGGSYAFGNATCRKKWDQIQGGSK